LPEPFPDEDADVTDIIIGGNIENMEEG